MNNEAVIIGYSGHAFVLIDILLSNKYNITGYCDVAPKSNNPYHLAYLGCEEEDAVLKLLRDKKVFIGIGDNIIRAGIFEYLIAENISCPSVIYHTSSISAKATLGAATVVMPGVVINSGAKIGNGVICNSSSVIEHGCNVGSYSHIAPGGVLAGDVTVGMRTFIGANSVVKEGIKIGNDVIIGAGSVIIKDVSDGLTVYGNPAK